MTRKSVDIKDENILFLNFLVQKNKSSLKEEIENSIKRDIENQLNDLKLKNKFEQYKAIINE